MASLDTTFIAKVTTILATWTQSINDFVWKGRNPNYVTSTNIGNAYTITLPSGSLYSSLVAGDSFTWQANATNTGAATLTVVGAASVTANLYSGSNTPLVAGDITAGILQTAIYDGTSFQLRGSQGRPDGFISVTAYGVVGDGVTNDTTAFQAALNAAAGVYTLHVDANLNCHVGQLTVPANTHLILDGQIFLINSSNTHVLWIQGSNVIIEGKGIVDGNKANNPTPTIVAPFEGVGGIVTTYGTSPNTNLSNITIRDITIQNCINWPISLNSVLNGEISGCTFLNSGNAPQYNVGSQHCTVSNCYSYGIPDFGFAFYEGCSFCSATGLVIDNCATMGVLNDGAAVSYRALPCHDITISGCSISNATNYGIIVNNATGSAAANPYSIIIKGNTVFNSGLANVTNASGILLGNTKEIAVLGNIINGGGTSSHPWTGVFLAGGNTYTTIEGNSISNGGQNGATTSTGIDINSQTTVVCIGNQIFDNQTSPTLTHGFSGVVGTNCSFIGNSITGTTGTYSSMTLAQDTMYLATSATGIGTFISGGATAGLTATYVGKQNANGGDGIIVQRNTDSAPAGRLLTFLNAANTQVLGFIDYGGNIVTPLVNNLAGTLSIGDASGEVQWKKPLVALGGGAGATLGTIGGTGPAVAAQNTWMRFFDSTGAAFWVPAWK